MIYIHTQSKIAKVSALDAMAHLANQFPTYQKEVKQKISFVAQSAVPSLRARSKKLSKKFPWTRSS